ncbi:hypothetical protein E2C01_093557 [Portunus trituberculatus]|uniref:Uncharacterized protein n=1 Tax=Portunus trituberculatus TaxID=210409 RepID=A0A5B7JJG6_PORTR|nr:hypothetical protein [Portunus trituberculatus]
MIHVFMTRDSTTRNTKSKHMTCDVTASLITERRSHTTCDPGRYTADVDDHERVQVGDKSIVVVVMVVLKSSVSCHVLMTSCIS